MAEALSSVEQIVLSVLQEQHEPIQPWRLVPIIGGTAFEILHILQGLAKRGYIAQEYNEENKEWFFWWWWRIQKAWLYYSTGPTKDYPKQFAEIRIYIYTRNPRLYTLDDFFDKLNQLMEEYVVTIMYSLMSGASFETEEQPINATEVVTVAPSEVEEPDTFFAYVAFRKKGGQTWYYEYRYDNKGKKWEQTLKGEELA